MTQVREKSPSNVDWVVVSDLKLHITYSSCSTYLHWEGPTPRLEEISDSILEIFTVQLIFHTIFRYFMAVFKLVLHSWIVFLSSAEAFRNNVLLDTGWDHRTSRSSTRCGSNAHSTLDSLHQVAHTHFTMLCSHCITQFFLQVTHCHVSLQYLIGIRHC